MGKPMSEISGKEKILSRQIANDDDFSAVRNSLIETYPITPPGFNWEVRRWDGWRFYANSPDWNPDREKQVRLWETEDGHLVGAVHLEGRSAILQLHPDFRFIEEDMIIWAEENLSVPIKDGDGRRLNIFVFEYDSPRTQILEKRGYKKTEKNGVFRRMRFGNLQLREPELDDNYTMRAVNPDDKNDCQKLADILNAAFNRNFHTADEYRTFAGHAPSYHKDMDLAAIAPDGSFAAYVGIPYNNENKYGVFEPVCTHPEHQRRGLARALMLEGLRRLKALGAMDVYVGTGDQPAANRLYDSVGFTEAYKEYLWQKII